MLAIAVGAIEGVKVGSTVGIVVGKDVEASPTLRDVTLPKMSPQKRRVPSLERLKPASTLSWQVSWFPSKSLHLNCQSSAPVAASRSTILPFPCYERVIDNRNVIRKNLSL